MSKGKQVSVHQYIARREEIVIRMNEIADLAEKEKSREFTAVETEELETLKREMNVLDVRIASAGKTGYVNVTARELAFDAFLRDAIINRDKQTSTLKREFVGVTSTDADAMIPLTINDVIKPLEEGLILSKVGLPMMMGLSGNYVWPVAGMIEAEVAGETVELSDSTIDFSKIKPEMQRVGVSITVTRETIFQTEGVAYEVVRQQLPQATARTLNKCMFNTDATVTHKLVGPFFDIVKNGIAVALSTLTTKAKKKACNYIAFAGEIPTYKELIAMRALTLLKGVEASYMAYIMDEYTKAILETTPVDPGSGRMIVENGTIAGIPVFCTNYINTEESTFIGFGCWGYEPLQGFGATSFVVDPYTKAKSNSVVLTLNGDYAMTTLRKEAFTLGKCLAE